MDATPTNPAQFEIIFVIQPSGPFGLPEKSVTVVPAGTELQSPALDTWSGKIVGHGTLPQYRREPIEATIPVAGGEVRLQDNFLFVTVAASHDHAAVASAERLAARFCMGLTMKVGRYFEASLFGGSRTDTRSPLNLPRVVPLLAACTYDLPALRDAVGTLPALLGTADEKLERSVAYFYHGAFLLESLNRIEDQLSFHAYYMLSEGILNLYKSMSVIVGDPSCGDRHQSQYKQYGISRDLWKRTEKIREARNDMDVAHYKATPEQFPFLLSAADEAKKTAVEVIDAYLASLAKQVAATCPERAR